MFSPGENARITWRFSGGNLSYQGFSFQESSRVREVLGTIISGVVGKRFIKGLTFDIESPLTLILRNVNETFNGTYSLLVLSQEGKAYISNVTVFIAGL